MKVRYSGAMAAAAMILSATANAELVSAVQVVVNDDVITYGQITDALAPRLPPRENTTEADWAQSANNVKNQVVQNLVERDLILHKFLTEGYQTNLLESFIDDRIKENIKREYYGDRWRLIETLQKQGITYEDYRQKEKEGFIVQYMVRENTSPNKILISPLKMQNYYNSHKDEFKVEDQVKIKMIDINQPADAPDGTAHRVCEEILRKVDAGVPFAEMASVYSASAQRGESNDRGWIDHSYLTPELSDVAFSLKPGQHSGVVQLSNGACYILEVEDKRTAHVKDLSEVRDEIERILKDEEAHRLHDRWIGRMRESSFVRFY